MHPNRAEHELYCIGSTFIYGIDPREVQDYGLLTSEQASDTLDGRLRCDGEGTDERHDALMRLAGRGRSRAASSVAPIWRSGNTDVHRVDCGPYATS
jgi:hypothetical protein